MSYLAGWPVPSSTSVNDSVTDVSVVATAARSDTVPGGSATSGPAPLASEQTAISGYTSSHPQRHAIVLTEANMRDIGLLLPHSRVMLAKAVLSFGQLKEPP